MNLSDIHWVAITTSVFLYMIIGAIWYSPFLFGEVWRQAMGFRPEKMTPKGKAWVGAILNAMLTAYGLSLFIHLTGAENGMEGMKIAFYAWLGFTVPAHFASVLWENKPLKVFFIHATGMLVTLLGMGFIIGGF